MRLPEASCSSIQVVDSTCTLSLTSINEYTAAFQLDNKHAGTDTVCHVHLNPENAPQ